MATGRILANSQQAVAALDLGGTKLACGLFAGEGRPLVKRVVPLERRQGKAVAEQVVQEARRLRSSAARRGMVIKAVAVAVPGIAHPRTGRVWAPNLQGWNDYPLRDELRDASRIPR